MLSDAYEVLGMPRQTFLIHKPPQFYVESRGGLLRYLRGDCSMEVFVRIYALIALCDD